MNIEYEQIREIELRGISSSTRNSAVYIVGQTGAGKTTLIRKLLQGKEYQNHVIIDSDKWRAFAPGYKEIVQRKGTDETKEIIEYTKYWRNQLFEECIKNKYNMIYHTSMTDIERIILQSKRLKENGYNLSLVTLVCNELESRLSNCIRYINSVLRKGIW